MSKRIIVSEWGEPEPWLRVFGLDEFIAAQTLDAEGKALGHDDGQMLDSEVEQLNAMKVGQRIRIGDPTMLSHTDGNLINRDLYQSIN